MIKEKLILFLCSTSLLLSGMDEQEYLQSLPPLPEETQQEIDYEYLSSLPPVPAQYYDEPISAEDIDKNIVKDAQRKINEFLVGNDAKVAEEFIDALNVKVKFDRTCAFKKTNDGNFLIVGSYKEGSSINSFYKLSIVSLNEARIIDTIEHLDEINKLMVTSDDRYVISASKDGTLKIYEFKTRSKYEIKHDASIASFDVSLDSKFVATASEDGIAKIIDLETKSEIQRTSRYAFKLSSIYFNADSTSLMIFSLDNKLHVYNIQNQEIYSMDCKFNNPDIVVQSTDNRYAIVSYKFCKRDPKQVLWENNGITMIYDLFERQQIATLNNTFNFIKIVKNRYIFLRQQFNSSQKHKVAVYDLEKRKCLLEAENNVINPHLDQNSFDAHYQYSLSNEKFDILKNTQSNTIVNIVEDKAEIYDSETEQTNVIKFDSVVRQVLAKTPLYFVVETENRSLVVYDLETKKVKYIDYSDAIENACKVFGEGFVFNDHFFLDSIEHSDSKNITINYHVQKAKARWHFFMIYDIESNKRSRHFSGTVDQAFDSKYLLYFLGNGEYSGDEIEYKVLDLQKNIEKNISVRGLNAINYSDVKHLKIIDDKLYCYCRYRIDVYDLETGNKIDVISKDIKEETIPSYFNNDNETNMKDYGTLSMGYFDENSTTKDNFSVKLRGDFVDIKRLNKSILYELEPIQIELIKWLYMQKKVDQFRMHKFQESKPIKLTKKMIEVFETLPTYVKNALLSNYKNLEFYDNSQSMQE